MIRTSRQAHPGSGNRPFRLGLMGKFVISISVLMIASSTSLGWFFLRHVRLMAEYELVEDGKFLSRHVAEKCELGVLTENAAILEEILGEALDDEDVVQAWVSNQEGEILVELKSFSFLPSRRTLPVSVQGSLVTPQEAGIRVEKRYSRKLSTNLYDITIPVLTLKRGEVEEEVTFLFENGGERSHRWESVGSVTLSLSSANMNHQIRILARGVLVLTLVVLVIGILIAYGLVRIIVEPTRRLVQATRRITDGDLTSLVEVRSQDEIGDLAISFNQMTVELKRSLDSLEDVNACLESKVMERTRELEATQNQLIQAEKLSALGQLVSGVAHELNNPLSGILGYSQLLLRGQVDGKMQKGLERIESEAQRCKKTVQNLQIFARKHLPQKRPVSIHAILESTLELRAYQLSVNDIQVVRKYDESLPQILADFHQLQQVFLNLIINAHQAMKGVDRKGILTIITKREKEKILVSIGDNGTGIPPDILSKIFDPFFTTKEVGQGTGLGLSICFGILQAHRGDIQVRSTAGETWFTVELPILDDRNMTPAGPQVEADSASGNGQGKSILVVDDEDTVAEVLSEVLILDGHRVEIARNGIAALEKIAENDYDLILSDLKMPGMDGEELFRRIKEINGPLARRIIFSTGDVASIATKKFLKETGNPCLQKPFEISLVRKIVARILREEVRKGG